MCEGLAGGFSSNKSAMLIARASDSFAVVFNEGHVTPRSIREMVSVSTSIWRAKNSCVQFRYLRLADMLEPSLFCSKKNSLSFTIECRPKKNKTASL